jgi:hypothetical protein
MQPTLSTVLPTVKGLVRGFEPGCIKPGCFKHILYHMIHFISGQGQILCIELCIELKKMQDKCPNTIQYYS